MITKRSTALRFTKDDKYVLVADKTGEVYRFVCTRYYKGKYNLSCMPVPNAGSSVLIPVARVNWLMCKVQFRSRRAATTYTHSGPFPCTALH